MWEEYTAEGNDYVPISMWGHDHWSTFAYLETRTVDYGGLVDNRHMRCNPRLHRAFAAHLAGGFDNRIADGSGYPTRLGGGKELDKHDDWSCLEDMVTAGLIKARQRVQYPGEVFGFAQAKVELTESGHRVAAVLRRHKAEGGKFGSFHLSAVPQGC